MQPRGKPLSVPLRPKNPTVLELAVHRYEVSAIKLYNQSLDESDPKSLKASQEDLKHLKTLRRSLKRTGIITKTTYRISRAKRSYFARRFNG